MFISSLYLKNIFWWLWNSRQLFPWSPFRCFLHFWYVVSSTSFSSKYFQISIVLPFLIYGLLRILFNFIAIGAFLASFYYGFGEEFHSPHRTYSDSNLLKCTAHCSMTQHVGNLVPVPCAFGKHCVFLLSLLDAVFHTRYLG